MFVSFEELFYFIKKNFVIYLSSNCLCDTHL